MITCHGKASLMATKQSDTAVFGGGQFIDGESVHVAPFSVASYTRAAFRVVAEFTKKALTGTGNTFVEHQHLKNSLTEVSYASGNLRMAALRAAPPDLSGYADDDVVCSVVVTYEVPVWTTPNYHFRVHAYHTGAADEVRVSGEATYIED